MDNNNANEPKASELKQKKSIFKMKRFWLALILIAACIYAGWIWYQGTRQYVTTDDAYIDSNRLSLSSKMLGRIIEINADEGDAVKKGEVLIRLESTDLSAQKNQAVAPLNLAQQTIQLAKVNLSKAQDDFERAKAQFESNVIPKEQYDHAQKNLQITQAQLDIDISRVGAANAQLGVISTQLQNTIITSPMDGVVAKKWLLVGDIVQPGQPILSIYDLDSVWVTADLQETDLHRISEGKQVEISVDSYPDHSFSGKILKVGTNTAAQFSLIPPNNASGNFTKVTQRVPIKISIEPDNPSLQVDPPTNMRLLPGMSVEIKIKAN